MFNFRVEYGVNWQVPNGVDSAKKSLPVTQVSYNDAVEYCKWANVSLPAYNEYWKYANEDKRKIVKDAKYILPVSEVNLIGNVWDITTTENQKGEIRLAGGSFLCNETTCNGMDPNRQLFVDKTTGNIHIGFSVIQK